MSYRQGKTRILGLGWTKIKNKINLGALGVKNKFLRVYLKKNKKFRENSKILMGVL